MFTIEIAELTIKIDNKYEYLRRYCENYITESDKADFTVSAEAEDIIREQDSNYPVGYLESLAVYRKIAEKIAEYDGFLMHSAIVDVSGCGVAFLALSGVGKTTHMLNWQRYLGNRVTIINGDKPLVRIIEGKPYAYGTPWAGKEGFETNSRTELKKICFIERSEFNECIKLEKNDVLKRLVNQIYIDKGFKVFKLLDCFIKQCEFYLIRCNTEAASAEIACEAVGI